VRVRSFACLGWLACSLALAPSQAAAQDPAELSLTLSVERNLVVREQLAVTASGTAPQAYSVWIFVVPHSAGCPPDPSGQPEEAVSIASGVTVGESFSVSGLYRPESTGPQSFCAYLRRFSTEPAVAAIELRRVLPPPLSSVVARHTVVVALRRHGFARRVIDALEARCHRRGRTVFGCRFKAGFRGYRLVGHGWARRRGDEFTYRFRVRAQGERFVLTDHNEGNLP
jgi:GNAT superfamily N-acetyltransferase